MSSVLEQLRFQSDCEVDSHVPGSLSDQCCFAIMRLHLGNWNFLEGYRLETVSCPIVREVEYKLRSRILEVVLLDIKHL